MLTTISPATAAVAATTSLTTKHQAYQQQPSQSQQLTNRLKNVYVKQKQYELPSAFDQQSFVSQLQFDDVQINERTGVVDKITTAAPPPTDNEPAASSPALAATLRHVCLMNSETPARASLQTPFVCKTSSMSTRTAATTAATTLASSAISAVASTLVKTTTNLTMSTRPSATLTSSLLLSSTPSSLLAATTSSALSATTTTLSTFLEGDLLPVVFLNSNIIHQQLNESSNITNTTSTTTHNRSNTTLGVADTAATTLSNSINFDDDDDNLNSFYFYETEQFAVLWILFTIIVLGNSAVLLVMFLNKNRKSRMNYFIKQLALADLFVGLLNVLTDIIWRITISWRAGNAACKIIRFSQVCVTYSSTYVLVAMSIDRYDAITHPMNFSKSWRRARYLVAVAWILSAIFSIPILMLYEEKLVQGQTQCWIELGSPQAWQVYMSLVSLTLFALPAIIISVCYAVIVKTIWAKGSIFVPAERAGFTSNTTRRASSRGIIPRAKVKTVKMTFVIVIVFILCWSPYIVFDLLQVFGHIPQTQTNIAIATFIQSLAPLNSAANPLIYCLFSSTVFRTLSRYAPFKWCTCWCESYRQDSAHGRCNTVGRRLHNSCDSMRTLTTSLTVSRRSNKRSTHVVIADTPKSNSVRHNAMSAV